MRITQIAVAAALVLSAGFSQATVIDVVSTGSWSTNSPSASAVRTFEIAKAGTYAFNFALTPSNASQPNIASLFGVTWNFAKAGPGAIDVVGTSSNVNANSFAQSFNFVADKAGKFDFYLAFTNHGTWVGQLDANVAPVPEPETYALMGMGLVGLLAARRRKAKLAA